jgi:hypothetical protein
MLFGNVFICSFCGWRLDERALWFVISLFVPDFSLSLFLLFIFYPIQLELLSIPPLGDHHFDLLYNLYNN